MRKILCKLIQKVTFGKVCLGWCELKKVWELSHTFFILTYIYNIKIIWRQKLMQHHQMM